LIEIGSKTAEINCTNIQTDRQTNRHYENNWSLGHEPTCGPPENRRRWQATPGDRKKNRNFKIYWKLRVKKL